MAKALKLVHQAEIADQAAHQLEDFEASERRKSYPAILAAAHTTRRLPPDPINLAGSAGNKYATCVGKGVLTHTAELQAA